MTGYVSESIARAGEVDRRSTRRQRGERFLDCSDVSALCRDIGTLRNEGCLERGDVRRHSDEHVEKEPEGPNENRDDPGTDSGHPAHPRSEFGNFGPKFRKVGLCRDSAGDPGMDRGGDGFGLRLFDARVPKPPGYRHGIKRNVRWHVRRSFRSCLSEIAHCAPNFQPMPRRALAIATSLLLALPTTVAAQSRPLGAAPDDSADIRAALGDCPLEELRAAYAEMLPLEKAAVNREVLAICTERAEAIARFLDAQSGLDQALAIVRAPSPAVAATADGTGAVGVRLDELRGEIEFLRERIALLEAEPEGPETEAKLADLRADLEATEAELARVEVEAELGGGLSGAGLPPVSAGFGTDDPASAAGIAPPDDARAEMVTSAPEAPLPPGDVPIPGTSLSEAAPEVAESAVEASLPAGSNGSGSAMGLISSIWTGAGETEGGQSASGVVSAPAALPVLSGLPADRRAQWHVIHAVRPGDGPWQVRLQGSREIAVRVPGTGPEDPDRIHWQPVVDPPVTLVVGESLPGGLTLLDVTAEGVVFGDPDAPLVIPFAIDGSSDPGAAEWVFETIVAAAPGAGLPEGLKVLAVRPEGALIVDPGTPGAEPVLVPFAGQDEGGGGS